MSRLQKKCLIASGTLHLVLLLVLVLTAAFAVKKQENVDLQVLNFVPDELVDAAMQQAAGQQQAQQQQQQPAQKQGEVTPPQAQPVNPEPPPKPQPRQEPEKVQPRPQPRQETKVEEKRPEPPKPKPEPERKPVVERKPEPEPKKPERVVVPVKVDLSQPTVRRNDDAIRKQQAEREAAAKAVAEQQRKDFETRRDRALSGVSSLASKLTNPTVGATSVDFGTVGVSYASYDSWVRKVYWDAWQPPNDLSGSDAVVRAKVIIRRDGTIESATVTGPSGNDRLDRNIRQLLARVKTIGRSFPDNAKETTRTYTIEFNLEAKLGSG